MGQNWWPGASNEAQLQLFHRNWSKPDVSLSNEKVARALQFNPIDFR